MQRLDIRYYELAVCGLYLDNLIFHSIDKIQPLTQVIIDLKTKKDLKAIVIKECEKPDFNTVQIKAVTQYCLSPLQADLAYFITYYYASKLGFVLGFFHTSMDYECEEVEIKNIPQLSCEQEKALDFIKKENSSLLFADTGSGKTEIYIALIKEYLNKGKQVLLLMPEIALTPQMQKRLEVYFKDNFFLWHSKISKKKKQEYLESFCQGKTLLVAGARSALFLPFRNLGLIIVDEEHDNSYKASNQPFINVRDLSLVLGQKNNIKVVLGSATPSLTSFYKQKSFRLKGTFFKSKKYFLYDENDLSVTPMLLNELQKSLNCKKQAIVFLPTRANFRQIVCKDCGETIQCPFCSIAMSMHKRKNVLKCHYCNYISLIEQSCPNCKGEMLEAKKMGTAELQELLQSALPLANIVKFDSDEITSVRKLNDILKDFNDNKIDILIGTSMLAKGHDYHSVDLSVILGLDEYLFHPSFKASEETLALAMQVAGRAGRKGEARVLLQTKNRAFFEKYIQDYDAFLKDELKNRKGLYPPFKRLLRVLVEDKDQFNAQKLCEELANCFKGIKHVELIGYGVCGVEKLHGKYRFYLLCRSENYKALIAIENYILQFKNVSADIDPIDFI
ncbi:primosomal protein N' [Campylobacter hepaticus]|uniref:Replication restart protein PriA n=1 Tax=Campylobacter hepaticus TaxID=1813019 RepID=A0A424Z0E2_9BACT|nr:primosomal protein N' [Campylobacter hepaticus]AXP08732.1 primosomal protein N' [Campylobacter hepaticus]MDX2323011.1 primosomal protein N' [Campylobacter hepaticus]MDX2330919.1 primosomal protein N' [Campylobacter hepaticus]MDX2332335.1 primosomal protein N' [Campylobacter hepaticus]MDX2371475.1 primosomal protein N' [Campylobacter hepaticus]